MDASQRLWRRMSTSQGEWWNENWTVDALIKHLSTIESVSKQFNDNNAFAKSFSAEVQHLFGEARKAGTFAVRSKDNTIRFRSQNEIDAIAESIANWDDMFESLSLESLKEERATSEQIQDLIQAWAALLTGAPLPEQFSIDIQTQLRSWPGFDLVHQAKKCAARISKLRFRNPEPAMAYVLVFVEAWNASDIMTNRLLSLRKEGNNPFQSSYPSSLVEHVAKLQDVDGDGEVAKGRTDLRHLDFVTIDPVDAKDFDDAIYLEKQASGWKLWVAIADVAHYVRPNTSLDDEAFSRATSVYLPHAVLPMLPPKLADELCSLRANVDRLAMVVCLHVDASMKITETEVFESVIRVRENLSYGDALGNDAFAEHFELSSRWQESEVKLRLEQAEMRPRISHDGDISIEVKWPNQATKMIESFMVATNAAIGHFLGKRGAPLLWRCHPPPDAPEVESVNATFDALGLTIELPMPSTRKHGQSDVDELANILGSMGAGISIDFGDVATTSQDTTPAYLVSVLDPEARHDILQSLEQAQQQASSLKSATRRVVDHGLFQLMQRAYYSPENHGHFGLNLDAYVHFTSPIRRYPDLLVHRQLKAYLAGKEFPIAEDALKRYAEQCNARARAAQKLEWGLVANAFGLKLLEGGELFEHSTPYTLESKWSARVVGLRTPWIFLDLADEGYISGRVHFRQFKPNEQLVTDEFDLKVLSAEAEDTLEPKEWLRVGQLVSCRIHGVDVWSGELDVQILNE